VIKANYLKVDSDSYLISIGNTGNKTVCTYMDSSAMEKYNLLDIELTEYILKSMGFSFDISRIDTTSKESETIRIYWKNFGIDPYVWMLTKIKYGI
jgi:hypothetical protein